MTFREEVINVELARMLCIKGLLASPENIVRHRKMPDVQIFVQGVNVVLEGKIGNSRLLYDQAVERIKCGLCEISIALLYDHSLKSCTSLEELSDKIIEYNYCGKIFYQSEDGIQEKEFKNINVDTFIESINCTVGLIVNADILRNLVEEVETEIEQLVNYTLKGNCWFNDDDVINRLKELLALEDINGDEKINKDILRIAIFVLFDAMIFQEGLRNINHNIASLSQAKSPYKMFFEEVWAKILEIDYKSIFKIARDILTNAFPNGVNGVEKILNMIRIISLKVINSGLLVRHDFMGRIYHKLLLRTTGQFYATYYTAVPSAYLLSNLIFKTPNDSWNFETVEKLNDFRIIDPACGSGTLLSASYTALKFLYLDKLNKDEYLKFHKSMMENSIYGWDVLKYATHLTLTVLGLHNPSVLIDKTNILKLPNGIDNKGKICLGSLSIMDNQCELVGDQFNEGAVIAGIDKESITHYPYTMNRECFDVVIMNPPFSRSAKPNIKFGYSSDVVKSKMNKKLQNILKEYNLTGIGRAGLGAVFIALGDILLKQNGRVGFVIPRGILSGVSWEKIRTLIFNKYEIKYIISNQDTGCKAMGIEGWNWSENTDLGEVMIIAEKSNKTLDEKEVIYINLWNKPENELESIFFTHQVINKELNGYLTEDIFQKITSRNYEVGTFYKVRQELIKDNWLPPCLFASPILNNLVLKLSELLKATRLSDLLINDGVDIKQIKDDFSKTNINTTYKIVYGQQNDMNKLKLSNNFIQHGIPKTSNAVPRFESNKSNFLLSERPHLSNDCIIATMSSIPVLATAYWELKFYTDKIEPLMLLWFNSTFGFIMYLSSALSSQGEIFKMKKGQFKNMSIIDPRKVDNTMFDRAAILVEILKSDYFLKFGEEFELAASGKGIRKIIDDFFMKEFDIILDMSIYYDILSKEPSMTRKRLIVTE